MRRLVYSFFLDARFCVSHGASWMVRHWLGPYLVVNCWLVGYTWLQHTDVDVPHLSADEFTYMRGAFLTIDRPYGPIFDWFHHKIGKPDPNPNPSPNPNLTPTSTRPLA